MLEGEPGAVMPTLLIRMSILPCFARAAATKAWTEVGEVTSAAITEMSRVGCSARRRERVRSAAERERSQPKVLTLLWASRRAVAAPLPQVVLVGDPT